MNDQKILQVVELYSDELRRRGYEPRRAGSTAIREGDRTYRLDHAAWMVEQIKLFVKAGKTGKAFRWLGFVQAILWQAGVYTISEMGKHNMPDLAEALEDPPCTVEEHDFGVARAKKLPFRDAWEEAADQIAALVGCKQWDYPGQLIRDVQWLVDAAQEVTSAHDALQIHAGIENLKRALGQRGARDEVA